MRHVRTCLLAAVLVAAPAHLSFAQGAPPKLAATAKPAAAPTASAKPSAQPTAPTATSAASATPASKYEISTDVDAAMDAKAQALFKEGNTLFRDAKYAKALAAYKAAYELELRSPKLVTNLAVTELELRMYRDAAEHFTIALRLTDASDPKRAKTQANLAEARANVGTIHFKLNVDGFEIVQMDNGRSYKPPLTDPIFVDPGKVGFRIRREGYMSQEKVLELEAGKEVTADINLDRAPGYGGAVGSATATTTATGPGARRSKIPGLLLDGAGVVAFGVGAALVWIASGVPGDIDSKLPKDANGNSLCRRTAQPGEDASCADLRSQAESGSAMGNAGIGLIIGGGVLVAAGVLYLVIPSGGGPANSKSSRVVPVAGKDGGGLVWTGSF